MLDMDNQDEMDQVFNRALKMLAFMNDADVVAHLVQSGVDSEMAALQVAAAKILFADMEK